MTKEILVILLRDIIANISQQHTKQTNTLSIQNANILALRF